MILCTSESQGFGPAANLVNYMESQTSHSIYSCLFIGNGTALEFFKSRNLETISLGYLELGKYLELNYKCIECVYSVMESRVAILAKRLGIRVIYIDLIYWLWNLEFCTERLKDCATKLMQATVADLTYQMNSFSSKKYTMEFMTMR